MNRAKKTPIYTLVILDKSGSMESIRKEEEARDGLDLIGEFNADEYSKSVFGMFGGKPERVTLSCTNRLANVMLDRFGSDITLLKDGETRVKITVNIVPSPIFLGWVISFGGEVEIISPDSVANEMNALLEKYK